EQGGMRPETLDELASWSRSVIVVATAGGRAAEHADSQALIPLGRLYEDPRVQTIGLSSELSTVEEAWIRKRYDSDVALALAAHGIGEHLVAARALAAKLEQERHELGDPDSPEGAALAWAAIDWSRTGMQGPVDRDLLRKLWESYQHGWKPSDQRFEQALEWALRPVHRTIALVREEDHGFRAFDWIAEHADRERVRAPNDAAWEIVFEAANPEQALLIGNSALTRRRYEHAERALTRATESSEPDVRALSWFNLGVALHNLGQTGSAKEAYEKAIDAEHFFWSPRAMVRVGYLLGLEGDTKGARAKYRQAVRSNHPSEKLVARNLLAQMLIAEGKLDQAVKELQKVIDSGHPEYAQAASVSLADALDKLKQTDAAIELLEATSKEGHRENAPMADLELGRILLKHDEPKRAMAALGRAIDSGHPHYGPLAAVKLGQLLRDRGDREGARAAYEKAVASGHPECAPGAALNIGTLLVEEEDLRGAETVFRDASKSNQLDIAALGLSNLAALFLAEGKPAKAIDIYRQASQSGHPDLAPRAALDLGNLLAVSSDIKGARTAYQQAIDSKRRPVAIEAESAMQRLPPLT
ncbi:MAG TPA: tetratricopeptide repeat protein, partial [Solirubrobacteraceae bacterium]|nr:tetratricopeptide repeat protein [Solirubrobacteraceae bacterium]